MKMRLTRGLLAEREPRSRNNWKTIFRIVGTNPSVSLRAEYSKYHDIKREEVIDSLEDILRQFTASETLKEEDMVVCDQCGNKACGNKQSNIISLPTILIMHLKRFRINKHGESCKQSRLVTFPQSLDMRPYFKNPPVPPTQTDIDGGEEPLSKPCVKPRIERAYELIAVVNHFGRLEYGHYTSCIKEGGRWWNYNDDVVAPLEDSDLVTAQAYILFYRKLH